MTELIFPELPENHSWEVALDSDGDYRVEIHRVIDGYYTDSVAHKYVANEYGDAGTRKLQRAIEGLGEKYNRGFRLIN